MTIPFPPPVSRGPVPAAYEAAAKAKLERDRKSYAAFRAVDQQQWERAHERRLAAAVTAAENEVRLFRLDVEALEPDAAAALDASRAAEDRARGAREYARTQEAEAVRIRETGTAEEVTDARVRADTADGVAAEREAAAAEARGELEGLERDLREAREGLETAERVLRAARKAAGAPAGTAPISDVTVTSCSAFMQRDEVWGQLSKGDRGRVRQAGEPRDMMSDREWAEMIREGLGRVEAV